MLMGLICASWLATVAVQEPKPVAVKLPLATQGVMSSSGNAVQPLLKVGKPGVVLIFVTQDCPNANAYTGEVERIFKSYQSKGFQFYYVQVDSTLEPAEAAKHAMEYHLTMPVVIDRKHELVHAVGATISPEAAVITESGRIAYRGRIDNLYVDLGKKRRTATQHDLRNALDAILAGKKIAAPYTEAIGCIIQKLPQK